MKFTHLLGSTPDAIYAWAKRLVDDLNRSQDIGDLPVFADDAAAAAGRVDISGAYVTPDGIVRRRMA